MSYPGELSQSDWVVLYELLEMASMEFGNHGCNDFNLPDTPEHRCLLERVAAIVEPDVRGWTPEFADDEETLLMTQDWELMDYFADFARRKAGLDVAS